jgi:D-sedoheptulose 7-phosphate isomerase
MKKDSFIDHYLTNFKNIIENVDKGELIRLIDRIKIIKKTKGRIFFLGVGGSGANCSHAVNDFRKIADIESYTPMDNVSEITANTNDHGWSSVFVNWLKVSKLNKKDLIVIFSVGGGNLKKNVSVNIIQAIKYAKKKFCDIVSIIGKNDGYAAKNSDFKILLPPVEDKKLLTPVSESFQAIIWHLLVTHPLIKENKTKW